MPPGSLAHRMPCFRPHAANGPSICFQLKECDIIQIQSSFPLSLTRAPKLLKFPGLNFYSLFINPF